MGYWKVSLHVRVVNLRMMVATVDAIIPGVGALVGAGIGTGIGTGAGTTAVKIESVKNECIENREPVMERCVCTMLHCFLQSDQKRINQMKLNEEFSVCKVAGKSFLVPLGARTMDMRKMLNLNGSALFLINALKEKEYAREELLALILENYDIDETTAAKDLDEFLAKTMQAGIILP